MKRLILILLTLLIAEVSLAESVQVKLETIKAIDDAAKAYQIRTEHLLKIAYIESRFKTDAINVNKNGTVDLGLFQINTIHWNVTCKGLDVYTPQGNALCAARLLKLARKHKENDLYWLGRYHSKTPSLKKKYYDLINSVDLSQIKTK